MHPLLENLTEAQRDAVRHVDGPLLILAGPGSGKTRVVTHRIAWLLEQGIAGSEILALTFTNKAAEEMRSRVEAISPTRGVWLSTFHRFCARLLRKYARLVGLEENFTIYDSDASTQLLRAAVAESRVDTGHFTLDAVANEISRAKANLVSAEEYRVTGRNLVEPAVAAIYPAYTRRLLSSNAVDFDDLLLHIATLLRDNAEVRHTLDARYRYILVDEYQDTNFAQYAIARALSIDVPNLAATGDPDQSIYGWRGANVRNILDFENDYPQVRVIRLEQNYRSTKRILSVADSLIRHNVRRKPKGLFTANEDGAPVRLVTYPTGRDESEDIARQIAEAIREGRHRPRDVAIFYRVNALSRAIELALGEAGLPYQLVNGLAFFQRKEIRDVVSYLQLLDNPRDQVAFVRAINTPARGIGKTTIDRLSAFAAEQDISFLDAAGRVGEIPKVAKRSAKAVAAFAAMIDRLSAAAAGPVEEILGLVLSESGYRQPLLDSNDVTDQDRLANIDELLTVAREFDERHAGGLEAFLEDTCLVNDTDDWEQSADRVTLMTLHAAKGLEFPVVYLIAVEENILPHERTRHDPIAVEEERRLMFVGITRAKQRLQISTSVVRDFRGQRRQAIPSHFLYELPRAEMECWPKIAAFAPGSAQADQDRANLERFDTEHDSFEDVHAEPEAEPVFRHSQPERSALPPRLPGLTTAAEMLEGGPGQPVSPEAFRLSMVVRHPAFGLGKIVALSGSEEERTATVDFSTAGRQRVSLIESELRPVK